MKKFFAQDSILVGIVAGLGSEMAFAAVLTIVLLATGLPIADHLKWYGGMFIPIILVLRHYMKTQHHLHATRTIIVVLFITFLAFMTYMLKSHTIVLQ